MKAREQELREKQIKALLVKKEQEAAAVVKEQQRQEQMGEIKGEMKKIEWGSQGGEKKNIRTLLSTVGLGVEVECRCIKSCGKEPISSRFRS